MKFFVVLFALVTIASAASIREKRWTGLLGGYSDIGFGGYSGYSAPAVVSVNKVVNVPRVVSVPQVVHVNRVVSQPQVISSPTIIGGYSGYGNGWW
ncbi:uncharacterized protein LOC114250049 [Bombyx mandarina]|uniref:Uncharacterized protein LOC114250049 n=2 Tax=Bombyx TaxID=7090 RepID=A0A6J2KD77_BOMMA|nr:cuticular protein glycine-rich 2 precursor [Bombyx mori]XP_028039588.1 uncharacterized protein LOC114250049 [Bombyx mandarina]FAA00440.1 TPA: putative cuticle protein [Bombyx mori]